MTLNLLRDRFGQLSAATIQDEEGERKLRFNDHAEHTFEWLVECGALLQGVVVTCPHCGTEQWRPVDDLSRLLRCRDCTADFALPSNPPWAFSVNGLVRNAITRYGVLPVVHVAWAMTDMAKAMAITIAPQELRESPDGPLVTDLDIVIIRDGEFVLGEVKSSVTSFDEAKMKVLEAVAKEIRPDRFVLAAPGTDWPPDVLVLFDAFIAALEPFDVAVEKRLLSW